MPKQEHPLRTLDDSYAAIEEFDRNSAERRHLPVRRMEPYPSETTTRLFTNPVRGL